MTNTDSLNKHLAEKVMYWELPDGSNFWVKGTGKDYATIHIDDWLPDKNIEQAMICLETFDNWGIGKTKNSLYNVVISDTDSNAPHKSLPMAISLACTKATGWEE